MGEETVENENQQELATQEASNEEKPGIDAILDINVMLTIEVGSTSMRLRDLLKLSNGSVVNLNKLAGEPLDIMVNGALIAHGEVVVVNDKYGIRLTHVASKTERLKQLDT